MRIVEGVYFFFPVNRMVLFSNYVSLDHVIHCLLQSWFYIFRIIENQLFKQDWRSRKKVQIFQYIVLKWAFALIIGLVTGLVGFFNNIAVENIAGYKLLLTTDLMLKQK